MNYDIGVGLLRNTMNQNKTFQKFHDGCCNLMTEYLDSICNGPPPKGDEENKPDTVLKIAKKHHRHLRDIMMNQTLEDLLARVFQRVPRYLLLLQADMKQSNWSKYLDPYNVGKEEYLQRTEQDDEKSRMLQNYNVDDNKRSTSGRKATTLDVYFIHPDAPLLEKANNLMNDMAFLINWSVSNRAHMLRIKDRVTGYPGVWIFFFFFSPFSPFFIIFSS